MNENELIELKNVLDKMNIELAHTMAKQSAILSMLIGVYRATLPEESSRMVVHNFCELLGANLNEAYSNLGDQDIIFDQAALLRAKFDVLEEMRYLKHTFD